MCVQRVLKLALFSFLRHQKLDGKTLLPIKSRIQHFAVAQSHDNMNVPGSQIFLRSDLASPDRDYAFVAPRFAQDRSDKVPKARPRSNVSHSRYETPRQQIFLADFALFAFRIVSQVRENIRATKRSTRSCQRYPASLFHPSDSPTNLISNLRVPTLSPFRTDKGRKEGRDAREKSAVSN